MKTVFSVGSGVCTDEEFARAAGEISNPDLEGWEMFVEFKDTKIYRKYKEVSPESIHCHLCICLQCNIVFVCRSQVYMSTRRLV